jgi:putative hydrolase of HD superfamily
MLTLSDLESFMRLLHATQNTERRGRIPDEQKWRNTAEHTFELTMLAWYVASVQKLPLDLQKVLSYALAHDIIEAYAGDTPITDAEALKTKVAREEAALQRIEEEFPEFSELTDTIHAYEKREDAESRFVYALDKLVDPLNASMEETQSIWKELNMTYEQMRTYKDPKIAYCDDVVPFWNELTQKLMSKKGFFFHE